MHYAKRFFLVCSYFKDFEERLITPVNKFIKDWAMILLHILQKTHNCRVIGILKDKS